LRPPAGSASRALTAEIALLMTSALSALGPMVPTARSVQQRTRRRLAFDRAGACGQVAMVSRTPVAARELASGGAAI
jgi:hypothetical protein